MIKQEKRKRDKGRRRESLEELRRQRQWQQINVKYVQGSLCKGVAGRINNKRFQWGKAGSSGREKRQGDSSGLMFICEFISFTVWSSFTGRIISLSRIFRLLDPRPSRSIPLPYPQQAIKILSATLLKNYGTLLARVLVLVSLLVRSPLARAD